MVKLGKSCWGKFSQEHTTILGRTFLDAIDSISKNEVSEAKEYSNVNWFQEFASQEDTSHVIWNFISSKTLSCMVLEILPLALEEWMNEASRTRSHKDFIISTVILNCLSDCLNKDLDRIFRQACKDAASDGQQCFNDMLKNTSFTCYMETGNYNVLNKILLFTVRSEVSIVVNKMLELSAQPQVNLGSDRQNMAPYYAIVYNKEDIVRSLFDKCDSKEQFTNAANEEGMTALHWACNAYFVDTSICQMIIEYGGRRMFKTIEAASPSTMELKEDMKILWMCRLGKPRLKISMKGWRRWLHRKTNMG